MNEPEILDSEEAGQQCLSYQDMDLPWYIVALWTISLACFAIYSWYWYLPGLSRWLA